MRLLSAIKSCLESRGLNLSYKPISTEDDNYENFTITNPDNGELSLNLSLDNSNNLEVLIKRNENFVENYTVECDKKSTLVSECSTAIDLFNEFCTVITDEYDDSELLVEDPDEIESDESSDTVDNSIIGKLSSVMKDVVSVSDKLKAISSMTDDLDAISIIMDLSNSGYTLAIDIEGAIDTYKSLYEYPEEIDESYNKESISDNTDKILKARLELSKSVSNVKKMISEGIISNEEYSELINRLI